MKIAILGTRGIPNHYGGFEQYAELLASFLAKEGYDVTVYNSHNHPFQEPNYKGVTIKHIYDPEKKIGTIGQFFYDLGCILDTRKQQYDLVYQLGYTSSAIFNFLFPKSTVIVTNMDGMEWKRTKYNKYVQHFLMYSEKIAVKHSHYLVADSLGIKEYLDKKYLTDAYFSAYTANIPSKYSSDFLANYLLVPYTYNLLIARMEPENNIDMILEAHTINGNNDNLVVIGNCTNKYGSTLVEKYKNYSNIKFIGAIYDKETIDSIRYYSKMYFHGHSVGGTNPSLLEAMSCECNIIAHNNIFNISVLGNDAYYFSNSIELNKIIADYENQNSFFGRCKSNNLNKIKTIYSESHVFCDLKNKLILWNNKID